MKGDKAVARISTVQARAEFSHTVNRVAYGGERLLLTRRGRDLAAMIPLEDMDTLLDALRKRLVGNSVHAEREQDVLSSERKG